MTQTHNAGELFTHVYLGFWSKKSRLRKWAVYATVSSLITQRPETSLERAGEVSNHKFNLILGIYLLRTVRRGFRLAPRPYLGAVTSCFLLATYSWLYSKLTLLHWNLYGFREFTGILIKLNLIIQWYNHSLLIARGPLGLQSRRTALPTVTTDSYMKINKCIGLHSYAFPYIMHRYNAWLDSFI